MLDTANYLSCGNRALASIDDPWEGDEPHLDLDTQADNAKQLWCGVLGNGLKEVVDGHGESDPAWLDSKDFEMVCQLAGMDADAVRDRAQDLLRNGTKMPHFSINMTHGN